MGGAAEFVQRVAASRRGAETMMEQPPSFRARGVSSRPSRTSGAAMLLLGTVWQLRSRRCQSRVAAALAPLVRAVWRPRSGGSAGTVWRPKSHLHAARRAARRVLARRRYALPSESQSRGAAPRSRRSCSRRRAALRLLACDGATQPVLAMAAAQSLTRDGEVLVLEAFGRDGRDGFSVAVAVGAVAEGAKFAAI
jgi:hypothetical protein